MKNPDLFISSAITATFPCTEPPPVLCVEENSISAACAEEILKDQLWLVAHNRRAQMQKVRYKMGECEHFRQVELNSRGVGLLVAEKCLRQADSPIPSGSDFIEANLSRYAGHALLDPRDMLFEEPTWSGAYATCFLVGDRRVMTAWHVFCKDTDAREALHLGNLRVVFDFEIKLNGRARSVYTREKNVFRVKAIESLPCPEEQGWVVLELESCATDGGSRTPLTCSTSELTTSTPVYTLGHPKRLTKRYVETDLDLKLEEGQFGAFVDAYAGSSGSPVFSKLDHKVVGMVNWSSQPDGYVTICGEFRRVSQLCLPAYTNKATLCFYSAAFAHEFHADSCS